MAENRVQAHEAPSRGRRRMTMRAVGTVALTCLLAGCGAGGDPSASQSSASEGLSYDAESSGSVPVPAAERDLQTTEASQWFEVSDGDVELEGPAFDDDGNLYFCNVSERKVMRLTPDQELSTVVTLDELSPGGVALRSDGRLFLAALDIPGGDGAILSVNPDGSDLQTVIPPEAGYMPNDLVFDEEDGFYFTDFQGSSTDPAGGVFHASSDAADISPVLEDLSMANGIALSPDGDELWATEFGRNLLHSAELENPTTVAPLGSAVPYHFTGPAPDSMRMDSDGNVYVAMYGQGRVLVFNSNGIPIGQILLPEREEGHNLLSTSMAIRPGTNDLYIVAADGEGGQGARIFHTEAFAEGISPR